MSDNKTTEILKVVALFIPVITALIKLIENWAAGRLTGPQKKGEAISVLRALWGGLSEPGPAHLPATKEMPFDVIEPLLGMVIDSAVSLANAVGEFNKDD